MTTSRDRLRAADRKAADARDRLTSTIVEAKAELAPARLLELAGKAARQQGESMAERVVGKLTSRPVLTTLALSLLGSLLRRGSVLRTIYGLFFGGAATRRTKKHSAIGTGTPPVEESGQ